MDLFAQDGTHNLLPYDGETVYFGPIEKGQRPAVRRAAAGNHFPVYSIKLAAARSPSPRKLPWHGDKPGITRTCSHSTKTAALWTPALAELKRLAEAADGESYNCCLLNLYHSGEMCMACI